MMKRITVLSLTISAILCLTSGSSRAQQPGANSLKVPTEKNTLIVYLSRTHNTKAVAQIIHQKIGGTLVALELETPYPADYRATVQQVVHENETGYLPPLKRRSTGLNNTSLYFWAFRPGECNCRRPLRASYTNTT
jgi:hypothetical protein